jgi:outer membrane protein OmpA-like peptidoglycan-associated protein
MKNLLVLLVGGLSAFLCPLLAQKQPVTVTVPVKTDYYNFADTARLRERQWEVGVAFGSLLYQGDLSNDSKYGFRTVQPMGGLFARRYVLPVLALRAHFQYGRMEETDLNNAARRERHFSFKTDISEIFLRAEWDIFGKRRFRFADTVTYNLDKYRQTAIVNVFRRRPFPYLFLGSGAIMTHARARFDLPTAEGIVLEAIQQDQRDGSGRQIRLGWQMGTGWHLDLSRHWVMSAEIGARTAFTDYFDGVSHAANPLKPDWYWFGGLQLARRLGTRDRDGDGVPDARDKCPRMPGRAITQGCPDADGDRIADREDECPHKVGVPGMAGCPFRGFRGNDSLPETDLLRIAGYNQIMDDAFFQKTDFFNFIDSARTWDKRIEMGLLAGHLHYLGDLVNDGPLGLRAIHPGGGVYLRKPVGPYLSLRIQGLYGKISDNDRYNKTRKERNYNFETSVAELTGQVEWDLLGKRRYNRIDTVAYILDRYRQKAVVRLFQPTVSPYVFAGGGATFLRSATTFDYIYGEKAGHLSRIAADEAVNGQRRTLPILMIGGGLRIDLNENWNMGASLSTRALFDDYLDGVSQAGNPDKDDWYWVAALSIGKKLGTADRDGDGTPDRRDLCPDMPGRSATKGCPDADADGIADREDQCPQRPGLAVKAGCPLTDTDRDSVPDLNDACPEVAGLPQFDGCPDTDGDGVEDRKDRCPDSPGKPEHGGCSDADGDGIEDSKDACPDKAGQAEHSGCPDTDGDGLEDSKDLCPDKAGKAEYGGCPDTDGDGTIDLIDTCPEKAGKPEFSGCPDSDGDGTGDNTDACPDKAGKPEWNGCPDSDGDGLPDHQDACPTVKGKPELKGCPATDSDKDGVPDALDECPKKAGKPEWNGCPDTDKDGIADNKDACPKLPGKPEWEGCPDSDADGIADNKDACPMLAGKPEYRGCPDTDGDGLGDADDFCPERPGPKDNKGCPTVAETDREELKTAISQVQFETAKATLKKESYVVLDEVVSILNKYKGYHVRLEGHTDNTGSEKSNQLLSEKRTKTCVEYLAKKGVLRSQLHPTGFGESQPVAPNDTPEGQAKNRRVELKLYLPD